MDDIYTIMEEMEKTSKKFDSFHEDAIMLIEAGLQVKDAKHKQWYLEKLYEKFTGFSRQEAADKVGFKFIEGVSP